MKKTIKILTTFLSGTFFGIVIFLAGRRLGFNTGKETGYTEGRNEGYADGYYLGLENGYTKGYHAACLKNND